MIITSGAAGYLAIQNLSRIHSHSGDLIWYPYYLLLVFVLGSLAIAIVIYKEKFKGGKEKFEIEDMVMLFLLLSLLSGALITLVQIL